MTQKEIEMVKLVHESNVIDKTDGSELAKAFKYLFEKYIESKIGSNDIIESEYIIEFKDFLVINKKKLKEFLTKSFNADDNDAYKTAEVKRGNALNTLYINGLLCALKDYFSDEDGIAVGEYWEHNSVIKVIKDYCGLSDNKNEK